MKRAKSNTKMADLDLDLDIAAVRLIMNVWYNVWYTYQQNIVVLASSHD